MVDGLCLSMKEKSIRVFVDRAIEVGLAPIVVLFLQALNLAFRRDGQGHHASAEPVF